MFRMPCVWPAWWRSLAVALLCAAGACVAAAVTDARGQLLTPPVLVATLERAQTDAVVAALGVQDLAGAARCDVRLFAINHATVGAHGESGANASAALLLPQPPQHASAADVRACGGALPLLAYARGTEVDRNRTMANPADFETQLLLSFFAAQGYAVVATDYLGYAQSTYPYHPYLHARSEASTLLDAMEAAQATMHDAGLAPPSALFVAGYSQGGHASMAAQRTAERAGGKPPLAAAAHLAGIYDVQAVLRRRQPWPGFRLIVPFALTAWQKVYGDIYARPQEAFRPPYATALADLLPATDASLADLVRAGRLPGGTPQQARAALMQPAFLRALQSDAAAPARMAARRNSLLDWRPKAPVLLCGAAHDLIVPPQLQQQPLVARWRAQGVTELASVDVAAHIRARHGATGAQPPSTNAPGAIEAWGAYHGVYQPPFCLAAARAWFDRVR